jgi:hypothetical protein
MKKHGVNNVVDNFVLHVNRKIIFFSSQHTHPPEPRKPDVPTQFHRCDDEASDRLLFPSSRLNRTLGSTTFLSQFSLSFLFSVLDKSTEPNHCRIYGALALKESFRVNFNRPLNFHLV